MHVCMIVHNNGTRDGRVMREAHALRATGHAVTVVGIPESGISAPAETLPDGVQVSRVRWLEPARRRRLRSAVLRSIPFGAAILALGYGLYRVAHWLSGLALAGRPSVLIGGVLVLALIAVIVALVGRGFLNKRASRNDATRRQVILGDAPPSSGFPAIRSRIPDWVPDWLLEFAVEPLDWFGARTGKFSLYRYRSEEIAAAAIRLKPDVVHCHDCAALPTGWLVKKALNIPLVYDAHEIYEAVAARRFGATDYFARIHARYLPQVDAFVAVNDSAATYYRYAYPAAPRAVVIRNATNYVASGRYDGRLHRAAGLPEHEKILLYQGGFSKDRGLQILVRAAPLLPEGWTLVMMGWGPLADELQHLADAGQANATSRRKVIFLSAVPPAELLSWTQGAAAGIIPYEDKMLNHWIATPNKLWEFPNAGVPMIVQPFPEMRGIVETYGCGWVLPELSPQAIADLVSSLTEEKVSAAKEGCVRFSQADNWATTYEPRLLDLYRRIEMMTGSTRAAA